MCEERVDVFALSVPSVPAGYMVVDTVCMRACVGGAALDQFVKLVGAEVVVREFRMHFKGINDKAPIKSDGEQ